MNCYLFFRLIRMIDGACHLFDEDYQETSCTLERSVVSHIFRVGSIRDKKCLDLMSSRCLLFMILVCQKSLLRGSMLRILGSKWLSKQFPKSRVQSLSLLSSAPNLFEVIFCMPRAQIRHRITGDNHPRQKAGLMRSQLSKSVHIHYLLSAAVPGALIGVNELNCPFDEIRMKPLLSIT